MSVGEYSKKIDDKNHEVFVNKSLNETRVSTVKNPVGLEAVPTKNDKIFLDDLNTKKNRLISGALETKFSLDEGETVLFSNETTFIKLKKDGSISINGDGDNFISFNDFKKVWDGLLRDLNLHIHLTAVGNSAPPLFPIRADIQKTKIKNLEVKN